MAAAAGAGGEGAPPPPADDGVASRALPASPPLLCFGSFSDTPVSRRLHRALQYLATPLRRAQSAAERRLAPQSLAARRLRALKLLRRRTPTPAEAQTELTESRAGGEAGAQEEEAPAEAPREREVLLNAPRDVAQAQRASFCGNAISTAKYNLLTFLPRFLFEMFSRLAYMCVA
jgi:hypothetical protein